jgi:hypothetical protein
MHKYIERHLKEEFNTYEKIFSRIAHFQVNEFILFRNASVSNVKLKRFSSACVFENN